MDCGQCKTVPWERGVLHYTWFKTCRPLNFSKQMTSECDQIQDPGSARCITAQKEIIRFHQMGSKQCKQCLGKEGFCTIHGSKHAGL